MRILYLYCHPLEDSFHAAIRDAGVTALKSAGHEVDLCDLYAEGFQPVLTAEMRRDYHDTSLNRKGIEGYVERLHAAEGMVVQFPTWAFGFPAMLKGFFDRILLPGFAFKYRPYSSLWDKLLAGRTAQILVTMDTPGWYYRWVWHRPGHAQMRHTILGFCGIQLERISEFAPVHGASEARRAAWLQQARALGQRCAQG